MRLKEQLQVLAAELIHSLTTSIGEGKDMSGKMENLVKILNSDTVGFHCFLPNSIILFLSGQKLPAREVDRVSLVKLCSLFILFHDKVN